MSAEVCLEKSSGTRVMGAVEEEVMNSFYDVRAAVWAKGGGGTFYTVEGLVEGDVSGAKLDEETGLVAPELGNDVEEIIGR